MVSSQPWCSLRRLRLLRGLRRLHLLVFPHCVQLFNQSVLFLFHFFLSVRSHFPLLNVLLSSGDLKLFDFRTDICQLVENRQHDKLDEACLSSCDVGGRSVAHHGNFKSLSFLHVSLVEEFFKQQISPLNGHFKASQRSRYIARVQDD